MGALTNLQRAYVPNNPVLNKIVKWFDAVSDFIDGFFTSQMSLLAAAYSDANVIINDYGIASMTHPSTGIYNLFLTTPITDNTNNYILSVSLANLSINETVIYDIGIQFVGANEIRVRVWSLADTAAPSLPIPADHAFYMKAEKLPIP